MKCELLFYCSPNGRKNAREVHLNASTIQFYRCYVTSIGFVHRFHALAFIDWHWLWSLHEVNSHSKKMANFHFDKSVYHKFIEMLVSKWHLLLFCCFCLKIDADRCFANSSVREVTAATQRQQQQQRHRFNQKLRGLSHTTFEIQKSFYVSPLQQLCVAV